ncbi:MAG: response regulator transcription factor [Bacteroidetes bacterium]|nr:response regulator transcription factor [Fibrella sp.]
MTLNCIAVDDEPLALGLVCAFIEKTPFLKLVGRFTSAVEALRGLQELTVDVIFLDIQMPDLTGIELARVLDRGAGRASQSRPGPRVVFTTAFNQFAVDGFRVDALDYLLKPFNYEEFLQAATKANAYFELVNRAAAPPEWQRPEDPPANDANAMVPSGEGEGRGENPVRRSDFADDAVEYLFLKVEYQLVRVAFSDICYIEGLKDYVKVHLVSTPKPLLSLTSLKALEEKLPPSRFMRVHRSFIVSLEKIGAVTRNTIQIGQITIPVSDQYKDAFTRFLSRWV